MVKLWRGPCEGGTGMIWSQLEIERGDGGICWRGYPSLCEITLLLFSLSSNKIPQMHDYVR
ncbi:unnamed protein product [Sphenostylis stenocarpa]|uniref:Uncharacterized protein n=1 Tax=Sphenostylis stenocarpa TaxID=92480 RepID=A0AA86S0G8_9FABA|nr:unnamed protein product [Sphenostylis stenocarpa]